MDRVRKILDMAKKKNLERLLEIQKNENNASKEVEKNLERLLELKKNENNASKEVEFCVVDKTQNEATLNVFEGVSLELQKNENNASKEVEFCVVDKTQNEATLNVFEGVSLELQKNENNASKEVEFCVVDKTQNKTTLNVFEEVSFNELADNNINCEDNSSDIPENIAEEMDFDSDNTISDPTYAFPHFDKNYNFDSSNSSYCSSTTRKAARNLEENLCENIVQIEPENKKLRKEKRNSGKSYINTAGKVVVERKVRELENCRNKCKEKITSEQQQIIFKQYWELGSYNRRLAYLSGLILIEDTKMQRQNKSTTNPRKRSHTYKYFVELNGKRIGVCQKCFRYTFSETEQFIKTVVKKKLANEGPLNITDFRGKHPGPKKISTEKEKGIINFINCFPSYESHYTRRDTSKRYLSQDLSIAELHRLYCEKFGPSISLSKFSQIFNTLNLKFKKPKVDTCHKCDIFKMKLDMANEEEKLKIKDEQSKHHINAEYAYESKNKDKECAKLDSTLKVFTFDLQQCLPTPFLKSSVSFYKRPLWTFNLTVHDCDTNEPICYMWHEGLANRGGNEISSCIYSHLQNISTLVKHIIFYSDSCPGQNKNSIISTMFETYMQLETNLEIIDHKFLEPGHTHMECDIDHGMIEKKKKKTTVKIHHPRDWFQFIRTVGVKKKFIVKEMKNSEFLDFSSLSKEKFMWRKTDTDGSKFVWQNIKWLRYTKDFGSIYYKTSLKENEPFKVLNIKRRGFNSVKTNDLRRCYSTAIKINTKKKQDLLDMLPLIDECHHNFYQSLSSEEMLDFHPDLTEFDEDE